MQDEFNLLWSRTRLARIAFIVGLLLGLFLGWFFHGIISFVFRFFLVLALLVPLVIVTYAWWRLRRQVDDGDRRSTIVRVDAWEIPRDRDDTYGRSSRRRTPED